MPAGVNGRQNSRRAEAGSWCRNPDPKVRPGLDPGAASWAAALQGELQGGGHGLAGGTCGVLTSFKGKLTSERLSLWILSRALSCTAVFSQLVRSSSTWEESRPCEQSVPQALLHTLMMFCRNILLSSSPWQTRDREPSGEHEGGTFSQQDRSPGVQCPVGTAALPGQHTGQAQQPLNWPRLPGRGSGQRPAGNPRLPAPLYTTAAS